MPEEKKRPENIHRLRSIKPGISHRPNASDPKAAGRLPLPYIQQTHTMGAGHSTPPPLVQVSAPRGKVFVPPGVYALLRDLPFHSLCSSNSADED
ncbi:uncharacterized protein K460DRAFT_363402 [Cucurbitaria berberidis CBS 394.84]|uniref:Uncharacterized protein n=1 Tax=Cucurbitaria berberidis CBS 394.84 TaxID=1168544 RepID=A0A9P4GJD0_9PLEO|nr:uncharacterized protein K460DRAFT_363402 [Cucurbitaria berberidis CBS 394.84]KAF1847308.1 hypothetical protein K460DRAFT_363402 [Cucurbitaria berberidis CBS 394.84]